MLAAERARSIIDLLTKNGSVVIRELSTTFNVSEETIRRDLERIGNADPTIIRVHGGAYKQRGVDEDAPLDFRESIYVEEKQRIAQICIEQVHPSQCVMLDSSTTALYIAKLIRERELTLTVITNSQRIAQELCESEHVSLICIGGQLRYSTKSYIGYQATESIKWYHADQAFVSCSGLHREFGITSYNEGEARIRSAMLEQANEKFLIADHTKFGRCAVNRMLPLSRISAIVTDQEPTTDWVTLIRDSEIRLLF